MNGVRGLVLLAVIMLGCGGSPEEKARQTVSFTTTTRKLVDGWLGGALPRRYTVDTLTVIAGQMHAPWVNDVADAIDRGDRARVVELRP
jgi:hypothetical protein